MAPARTSCGDLASSLQLSQESTIIFGPKMSHDNLKSHVVLTITVRGSYDIAIIRLRATGLRFFQICHCAGVKQNRRGHDARKSV